MFGRLIKERNAQAISMAISVKETESDFSNNNSLGSKGEDYYKNSSISKDLAIKESSKLCEKSSSNA